MMLWRLPEQGTRGTSQGTQLSCDDECMHSPSTWHGEAEPPVVKKDFQAEQMLKVSKKLYSQQGNKKSLKASQVLSAYDVDEDTPGFSQGHEDHKGGSIQAVAIPPNNSTYLEQGPDQWASEIPALNFSIGREPGMKVSVYAADLTKVEVDAIVNPANQDLSLVGGLSYAILKAAHEDLQEECTKHVSVHGPLKVHH